MVSFIYCHLLRNFVSYCQAIAKGGVSAGFPEGRKANDYYPTYCLRNIGFSSYYNAGEYHVEAVKKHTKISPTGKSELIFV